VKRVQILRLQHQKAIVDFAQEAKGHRLLTRWDIEQHGFMNQQAQFIAVAGKFQTGWRQGNHHRTVVLSGAPPPDEPLFVQALQLA
jgi:hypothetical protein